MISLLCNSLKWYQTSQLNCNAQFISYTIRWQAVVGASCRCSVCASCRFRFPHLPIKRISLPPCPLTCLPRFKVDSDAKRILLPLILFCIELHVIALYLVALNIVLVVIWQHMNIVPKHLKSGYNIQVLWSVSMISKIYFLLCVFDHTQYKIWYFECFH